MVRRLIEMCYLLVATIEIEDARVVIWDVGGHVLSSRSGLYCIEVHAFYVEQILSRLSWSDLFDRQ